MVLPDIVQAVQLVRAYRRGDIPDTSLWRKLTRAVRMLDFLDMLLGHTDEAVCVTVRYCESKENTEEYTSNYLHFIISYHAFSTSGFGGPLNGLYHQSEPLKCRWTYG